MPQRPMHDVGAGRTPTLASLWYLKGLYFSLGPSQKQFETMTIR